MQWLVSCQKTFILYYTSFHFYCGLTATAGGSYQDSIDCCLPTLRKSQLQCIDRILFSECKHLTGKRLIPEKEKESKMIPRAKNKRKKTEEKTFKKEKMKQEKEEEKEKQEKEDRYQKGIQGSRKHSQGHPLPYTHVFQHCVSPVNRSMFIVPYSTARNFINRKPAMNTARGESWCGKADFKATTPKA